MRGFRTTLGISSRPYAGSILFLFILIVMLVNSGCAGLVSGGTPGGGTPLTISSVQASTPTLTGFQVSWATSIAADSVVDYGTSASYGSSTPVNPSMVTSHQITLSGLAAGTAYYYQVRSTDSKGNNGKSGGHSFKTAGFSISGTINPATGGSGATLTLGGAANATTTTDSLGNYAFAGLPNGTYTIVPSHAGFTFTPSSQSTTVNGANVTAVNFTVNPAVAPTITTQPVNQTVTVGQTATFTVAAAGTAPLSYQWQKNGVNIAGATATSYTTPATTASDSGSTFAVVVTNTAGTVTSATATLTVNPGPSITSLNPASGLVGTSVTINGANFGAAQGTSTVTFNGITATPTSWSGASIVVPVPAGATAGNVVVTVGGVASNGVAFTVTVPVPSITNLNPATGLVGTPVTIAGANFGAAQGTSTVKFNGIVATPTSWSATSIVVPVPAGATTGNVVVTVGGVASNGVAFTVTVPVPSITNLNPVTGLVGTPVTIAGANFGAAQGTSTVKFNGIAATPTSWSAASIVAAVPAGATTGNVVVTVGGVASNGVGFTVSADTTPPVVTITAPANNSTASATITLTATATDPDSAVSFVQFQVDGVNVGAQLTTAPYSLTLDTTTLSNATHSLTAVGQDPSGNVGTSATVTITVSNTTNTAMGPLKQSAVNPRYFVTPSGKAVLLSGSQTWNTFQDTDQSISPAAFDFTAYVNFLKAHGHNTTILWRKDLPTYCNWGAGGTWHMAPFPWKRTGGSTGTQVASDGLPAFDLTQLDQAYFDRLRARVIQLQQNGIYAIVELFDGLGLVNNRCSNDGYPFTGGNNVNGVNDGGGTNSMTMGSPNTITNYQDAFVQKVIDTVNDQPNVLWEPSEEAPSNSTWWQGHMISLIRTYEAGKPNQHPVGYAILQSLGPDSTLYNSNADWVAPAARISPTSSCGSGTPQCKVNINDSDHSYFGMWNDSAQTNRTFIWENFTNGNSVLFMDPYVIYWTSGNRNLCSSPVNGVCSGPDSRWNNFRDNMGYMLSYANNKLDLLKMTPQGNLSSTGFCLADNVATGAEYLVYAPNGGTFTVNLSATTRTLNVEWLNPSSGAITTGGTIAGGSANQSFTPPFSGDAVLYLVDIAGHN